MIYIILFFTFLALGGSVILFLHKPGWGRIPQLLCIVGISTSIITIFLLPTWLPSTRVSVIIYGENLVKGNWKSKVNKTIDHLKKKQTIAEYQVIVVNSKKKNNREQSNRNRRYLFFPFYNILKRTQEYYAPNIDGAFSIVCQSWDNISFVGKIYDAIVGKQTRIILLRGKDNTPKAFSLKGPLKSIAKRQIIVDVVLCHLNKNFNKNLAHFEIVAPDKVMSGRFMSSMSEKLILRVKSPKLKGYTKNKVTYIFKGIIDPKSNKSFVLKGQKGRRKISKEGFFELPVFLKDVEDDSIYRTLKRGFHLVQCHINFPALDIKVSSSVYLYAYSHKVIFIDGKNGTFIDKTENLETLWREATSLSTRVPWSIDIDNSSFISPKEYTRKPAQSPFLIVLHDIPLQTWKDVKFINKLSHDVSEGAHLLICGFPPQFKNLPAFIPAVSIPETSVKKQNAASWVVSRKSRVTVLHNYCRIGRFPRKASLNKALPQKQGEVTSLASIQKKIVSSLRKKTEVQEIFHEKFLSQQQAYNQMKKWRKSYYSLCITNSLAASFTQILPHELKKKVLQSNKILPFSHELNRPKSNEIAVGDVVIIFSFTLQQPENKGILTALLARGVFVIIVPVDFAPYVKNVNTYSKKKFSISFEDYYKNEAQPQGEYSRYRKNIPIKKADFRNRCILLKNKINLLQKTNYQRIANEIYHYIAKVQSPIALSLRANHFSRFLNDSRIEYLFSLPNQSDKHWSAPITFQITKPNPQNSADIFPCYMSIYSTTPHSLQAKYPCTYGGIYKNSLIAGFSYSFFESFTKARDIKQSIYSPLPETGRDKKNSHDLWGIQRVIDFMNGCLQLQSLPSEKPKILGISMDHYNRIQFKIQKRIPKQSIPDLKLSIENTVQKQTERLNLINIDYAKNIFSFELLPSQITRLTNASFSGLWMKLNYKGAKVGESFFLPLNTTSILEDLTVENTLKAIAIFSGGSEVDDISQIPTYSFFTGLLSTFFMIACIAAFWTVVAMRKIYQYRKYYKRTIADSSHKLMDISMENIVSEQATNLRESKCTKIGEFSHYKTFEPGDDLGNIVPIDLIKMTYLNYPTIPRTKFRFHYLSFPLYIILQNNTSLHTPTKTPIKFLTALQVIDLVANIAWLKGAQVHFISLNQQQPNINGPYPTSISREQINEFYTENTRKGTFSPLPDLPDEARVIYVSDFLLDDTSKIYRQLQQTSFSSAAICIHNKNELDLCVLGWIKGVSVLNDRSYWTYEDMKMAYRTHISQSPLQNVAGGVTLISSDMNMENILEVVSNSSLIETLR